MSFLTKWMVTMFTTDFFFTKICFLFLSSTFFFQQSGSDLRFTPFFSRQRAFWKNFPFFWPRGFSNVFKVEKLSMKMANRIFSKEGPLFFQIFFPFEFPFF